MNETPPPTTPLPELGRQIDRRRLRLAAAGYRRDRHEDSLVHFLPGRLAARALADGDAPRVTWAVIRHLCRSLRADRRRGLGGGTMATPSIQVKRALLAGEIALLARQRRNGPPHLDHTRSRIMRRDIQITSHIALNGEESLTFRIEADAVALDGPGGRLVLSGAQWRAVVSEWDRARPLLSGFCKDGGAAPPAP